ncbi:AMIN-like domain-containing (lipo)protein [Parafrankia discariae]|uniref:AMIN-like domain-containing (lipo)protein n=1 Tax=Parafrankia discariae TaxID=365528 RepID=UPI0012B6AA4B|nr:hypothetical protein [Parafrankia discariae]
MERSPTPHRLTPSRLAAHVFAARGPAARGPAPDRRLAPHRLTRGGTAVLAVLLGAALTTLAACGDGSGGAGPDGAPAPRTNAAPSAPGGGSPSADPAGTPGADGPSGTAGDDGAAGPAAVPSTWGTREVRVEHPVTPPARLVALRAARNVQGGAAYDRLVLEFSGGLPGYTAGYVDEVIRPGSGAPLPLRGPVTFEVVVTPAVAHGAAGESTLTTPPTGGELSGLVSYALAGDYEGYVHLGVGLGSRVGFRVVELRDPARLAIDFAG